MAKTVAIGIGMLVSETKAGSPSTATWLAIAGKLVTVAKAGPLLTATWLMLLVVLPAELLEDMGAICAACWDPGRLGTIKTEDWEVENERSVWLVWGASVLAGI